MPNDRPPSIRDKIAAFNNSNVNINNNNNSTTSTNSGITSGKLSPHNSTIRSTTSTMNNVNSNNSNNNLSITSSTTTTTSGSSNTGVRTVKPTGTFKTKTLPPTPTNRSSLNINAIHNNNTSSSTTTINNNNNITPNIDNNIESTTIPNHNNNNNQEDNTLTSNGGGSFYHQQQQQQHGNSMIKKTTSDLTLPKNKPAVPPRFRPGGGGGNTTTTTGTATTTTINNNNNGLGSTTNTTSTNLSPNTTAAIVSNNITSVIEESNNIATTITTNNNTTTNNNSNNNNTSMNGVRKLNKPPPIPPPARRVHNDGNNLDNNTTLTEGVTDQTTDAINSARLSIRASGVQGVGNNVPQGKFIPYVPPEEEEGSVNNVSVSTTNASGNGNLTGEHKEESTRASITAMNSSETEVEEYKQLYKIPTRQQIEAVKILQRYVKRCNAIKLFKKLKKARMNRENCSKEILSTEKYYVESLNVMQEVYLKPLKVMSSKEKPIITKEEVQAIFSDIEVIINVNTTFLNDLEERMKNYVYETQLSDIFLTMAPFFKTYSRYCNNYDRANEVLKKCKEREELKEVVLKMDKDSRTSKLGLQSYLILPIQRIPRYRLLLQDLIKHSGPDHPDYQGLKNALDKICEVADHLNNTMKIIDGTNEILKIQGQFYGELNLVEPHRRFIKDGPILEVISNDLAKTSSSHIHLFNDIVLFSQKGSKFTLKSQLPLNNLILFNYVNQEDQIDDLIFKIQSPGKSVILKALSKEDKDNWTITFYNLIKECKQSKKNKTLNVDVNTMADDSSTTFALAMANDNDDNDISPEQCVERLKQGSTMLKYCRNGRPHFRRFVLSIDETQLMWGSPNKQSHESVVSLTDVKKICYGQNTAVFQKYKNPDLEGLSFSLLYRDRTLDIVCTDRQEYHVWVQGITYLLSNMDKIVQRKKYGGQHGSTSSLSTLSSSNESTDLNSSFILPTKGIDMAVEKAKFKEQFERIGDAYTWGQGSFGGLGHGSQEDKREPLVVKDFLYLDVGIAKCENSAGAAVMLTGELFTWGKGEKGRLGHGDVNDRVKPTYVKALQGRTIKDVSMGNLHTLALDSTGTVFAFGDYQYGQLGIEKFDGFVSVPTILPICSSNGFKVSKIECGHWHSAIISEDGQLLTFGRGEDGQLGHGDKNNRHTPTPVKGTVLDDYKVVDVACGLWHTMALTEEGFLFSWGNNTYGQLGHGDTDEHLSPIFVEAFRKYPVTQISAGSAHSGCITCDGSVYMWGNGIYGQIGNNTNTHAFTPTRVKSIGKAKQLACGVNHVLVLCDDGAVYGWGAGTYGRLGLGTEADHRTPIKINFFEGKTVRYIGAGGSQSAAVCAHQWVPDEDATDCMSCKSKFTFLRRRHHCRYCGGIFCGSCTTKRITLLRFGFDTPVRIDFSTELNKLDTERENLKKQLDEPTSGSDNNYSVTEIREKLENIHFVVPNNSDYLSKVINSGFGSLVEECKQKKRVSIFDCESPISSN
ncbi:hypothetical protein ABK040_000694 [Willaertia magna]